MAPAPSTDAPPSSERLRILMLVALGCLALVLRAWDLGGASLWMDEGGSVMLSSGTWGVIVRRILAEENHPPLFYLFLHAWMATGSTEAWMRLPGALCGVGAVLLLPWIGRRLGDERAGLLGGLVLAVDPLAVLVSRELRMYPLAAFLLVACTGLLVDALATGRVRSWVGFGLAAAAAGMTHYLAMLAVFLQFTFLLGMVVARRLPLASRNASIVAAAACGLVFGAWMLAKGDPTLHGTGLLPTFATTVQGNPGLQLLDLGYVFTFGYTLFFRAMWQYYAMAGLAAGALGLGLASALRARSPGWGVVAFTLAGTVLVALVLSHLSLGGSFKPRYFSLLCPLFCLMLARGALRVPGRAVAGALLGFFVVLGAVSSFNLLYHPEWGTQDWRSALHWLRGGVRSGDVVLMVPRYNDTLVDYYTPDLREVTDLVGVGPEIAQAFDPGPLRGRRVWLVEAEAAMVDPTGRVRGALQATHPSAERRTWARRNAAFTVVVERFDPVR